MKCRLALILLLFVAVASPLSAYLKLGAQVGSRVIGIRWTTQPIRYFVTNRDVSGVTAPDLQGAVARAFATWSAVPDVAMTSEFVGFTTAEPFVSEGMSVIGFRARPDLARTLGATTFTLDAVTGAVQESDVFFNTAFAWSTANAGEAQRFDVESIALHEIGHLLGLGHSALGETELSVNGGRRVLAKGAVMFPIAFPPGTVRDRAPMADDVAGLRDVYRTTTIDRATGSIAGRVTLNGRGVFGAHVTAFNTGTGDLVGSFATDPTGGFVLASLYPGLYVVRAEPLDDGDVESFFEPDATIEIGFKPGYASRLIAVPAGGGVDAGEIRVTAR